MSKKKIRNMGVYLVLGFVTVMMFAFCQEAKAEVTLEVGPTFLSGELAKGGNLSITERWGGPYGSRYAVGIGYISEQEVLPTWEASQGLPAVELRENLYVHAQRRVSFKMKGCPDWDCISLGVGAAYFNDTNRAIGSNFSASLSIEVRPSKHWSLSIRHFSNAGSSTPNMGQDMLLLGYTF